MKEKENKTWVFDLDGTFCEEKMSLMLVSFYQNSFNKRKKEMYMFTFLFLFYIIILVKISKR